MNPHPPRQRPSLMPHRRPTLPLLAHPAQPRPHRPPPNPPPKPILVGYFGQWGVYDGILPLSLVTSHADNRPRPDQLRPGLRQRRPLHRSRPPRRPQPPLHRRKLHQPHRPTTPTAPFRGNLHQLAELKRLHPETQTPHLARRQAQTTSPSTHAPKTAPRSSSSCVDIFLRGHLAPGVTQPRLFDGIDLDWEYPHGDDAANFLALVTGLRHAMSAVRPGLRLSIAVGASPHMYEAVDIPAVAAVVDQVGVMNYDYHGPWNPYTDFIAPLFAYLPNTTPPSPTTSATPNTPSPAFSPKPKRRQRLPLPRPSGSKPASPHHQTPPRPPLLRLRLATGRPHQ